MLLQNWIRLLYSLNHKQRFAMYRITFIAHANGENYVTCCLCCFMVTACYTNSSTGLSQLPPVLWIMQYPTYLRAWIMTYTRNIPSILNCIIYSRWMVCSCCCGVQRRTRKLLPPRSTIDINQDDFMVLELERVPWLVSCLTFRHIRSLCSN